MRLWSIHPAYLDKAGLVALWREGLLARKVLLGDTMGYRNHPQLERFKSQSDPVASIDAYLSHVCHEADNRGYSFERKKIGYGLHSQRIPVTRGQLDYEFEHLMRKLRRRDKTWFMRMSMLRDPEPNPAFRTVQGPVERWERFKPG